MNRLGLTLCWLCVAGLAQAQEATLRITNSEKEQLFFLLNPMGLNENSLAEGFRMLETTALRTLASGESSELAGLSPGVQSILCFWVVEGEKQYSVFRVDVLLEAGKGKVLILKKTGAEVRQASGSTEFLSSTKKAPLVIDNKFSDWRDYPALCLLGPSARPLNFILQTPSLKQTLPLAESIFWARGGTQLDTVKGVDTAEMLYFYFASPTPLAKGLSIFLYLRRKDSDGSLNEYTLELTLPEGSSYGKVLLWQRGKTNASVVGQFSFSGFFIEAEVSKGLLPLELASKLVDFYLAELTTAFYEPNQKLYEEFFLTSFEFSDLQRY